MDKETIQKLAIEAGFEPYETYHLSGNSEDDRLVSVGEYPCGESVIKFAELVAKAERESCAKVVEDAGAYTEWNEDAVYCAAAIRGR